MSITLYIWHLLVSHLKLPCNVVVVLLTAVDQNASKVWRLPVCNNR